MARREEFLIRRTAEKRNLKMRTMPSFLQPLLTAVLLFCSAICFSPASEAAQGPQEALSAIGASMESADTASFSKLVDLDGISRQALGDLAKLASDPNTSQWMPPTLALMASKGGLTNSHVQSFLASEIREFVLYGVGSGGFGGRPVNDYKSRSMFGPLFAMASLGKKQITKIGTPEALSGGRQMLPFTVHDENGNDYPVEGVFSPDGDGWRMTGINNMQELILIVCREATAQDE